jgi:cation diffusion facilitator CzcD-associated flavoprotein CzcO
MPPHALPHCVDIALIGAGPHALTLSAYLQQKAAKKRRNFLVFDPKGSWLQQWRHQFAALEIPHLRSPAVHHPDPNPFALRKFAEDYPDPFFPPYDLPKTPVFNEFCATVVERWQLRDRVYGAAVTQILPLAPRRFQLILETGQIITARRVVLATGAARKAIPPWVTQITTAYPPEALSHAHSLDLRGQQLRGDRILIIGGGLTSGHLAVGAMARQARVTLIARRTWQEKLFDADPGWLGPKYLKEFAAEPDWSRRARAIRQARNGGSLPPAMMLQLRRAARGGNIVLEDNCEVVRADWQGQEWRVQCQTGQVLHCDRIWLATGSQFDAARDPLLQDILAAYPTEIVDGLPILDRQLRIPGCACFVMGGYAALQVGPVARNLAGARMASDRIIPALIKPSYGLTTPAAIAGECTSAYASLDR